MYGPPPICEIVADKPRPPATKATASHVGFLKDQLARVLPVPTSLTLSGLSLA